MNILKWLFIPIVAFIAFVTYSFILSFLSQLIPVLGVSNKTCVLMILVLSAFFASALIAVPCAYLFTSLYKNKAVWVSFCVALPTLIVLLSQLSSITNPKASTLIMLYEATAYLTLMLACSFIVSKNIE